MRKLKIAIMKPTGIMVIWHPEFVQAWVNVHVKYHYGRDIAHNA
jgi:hypothetical protein